MSEEQFDSIDHIKDTIKKRKRAERKRKRRRVMAVVYRLLIVGAIITGLVLFDRSEYSRIRQIRIEGNQVFTDAEIIETLHLKEGDRILTNLPFFINQRGKKVAGLDSIEANLYYSQGIVNVHVNEVKAVGYIQSETITVLFEDGSQKPLDASSLSSLKGLPVLVGFTEETLNKELLEAFGKLDQELILAISEVHSEPSAYDPSYMKLVMNNNYYVFTGGETLPLMRSYASIISKADPGSRCIIMSEYGPTENQVLATAKPCE